MILNDEELEIMSKCAEKKYCSDCEINSDRDCTGDACHTTIHNKKEFDIKEIAYMKQVHNLEKEVESLKNIEQELTDLKNHYKSKIL